MTYLHNHTDRGSNLRMLDCTTKTKSLIDRALELGASGVAITDHESLSSHVEAIKYINELRTKKRINDDFKLVLGNEIYLIDEIENINNQKKVSTPFYHFILLAKDAVGHKQLRYLSSLAWSNSFRTGKMERVPTLKSTLEEVIVSEPGHLIATTACIGGELGHSILDYRLNQNISARSKTLHFIEWCKQLFGEDFYLEMQPSHNREQIIVNCEILNLSEQTNVPFIITTDTHYLKKEDRPVHEAYLNSREDEEREVGEFYATTYLMSPQEIHEYMDKQIDKENVSRALANTILISDKIQQLDLYHKQIVPRVSIPKFEMQHSFANAYEKYPYLKKFAYSSEQVDRYILYLIEEGWWNKQYTSDLTADEIETMISRINDELGAVWETSIKLEDNVSSYYISALEIVNMMWDDSEDGGNSLVGCSRGSIASFYISYLIGIQQLNPLKWNIPWWRHLHASRPEMPDIDIDTEKSKRMRIIEATRKKWGHDRVLNICTFKTEGSKSSILTAARGLGIDNDIAQYLANMIPVVRGKTTSLHVMLYGDEENEVKPNTEFINECNQYPGLLETAMSIEGLVCGRSIHASGVIIFASSYIDHNCMMKAPNGIPTTQWSMEDSEYCGGLKYDFLTITNLDAMHICMDFLIQYGYIEWQGNLRQTYNKYFHPDVLDYDSEDMWKMAENLEIVNLFQFQTQVGAKAIQAIKPRNLRELGTANSAMRLMVKEGEQPVDTFVRYKNNISEWYKCMTEDYHLTPSEVAIVEKHLKDVYGMASMQEEVMRMVMDPHIANFSMQEANKLRKSIAKKKTKLQMEAKELFYKKGNEINTSHNLLDYVWIEVISKQLGYSFSLPHVAGYSTIAVQEMNMAYHYPIIYWNTANLIVDSGSLDMGEESKATEYGKIATAISNMQLIGTEIALPLINSADFGFVPDEQNNRIIYSLKAINGIGDDVVNILIQNRPYNSMGDFYERMIDTGLIKKAQMIQLIKAGCFTELDDPDRRQTMTFFIGHYVVEPISKLTLSQFDRLMLFNEKYHFIPENILLSIKHKYFKDYVLDSDYVSRTVIDPKRKVPQRGYHDRLFELDDPSMDFFISNYSEDSVVDVNGVHYIISEKKFIKENTKHLQPLKDWMQTKDVVGVYNACLFRDAWVKYASGTVSQWEMQSLSIYAKTEHELLHINSELYGVEDFSSMSPAAEPYTFYTRTVKMKANGETYSMKKEFPKYLIKRICGTVIDKNKDKHMITLLTTTGVVTVKFNKGEFSYYDKQISKVNDNGSKTRIESSWFERGNKVMVCGYRSGNLFRAKKYNDTIWKHTCYLITKVEDDGKLSVLTERVNVEESEVA